MPSTSKRTRRRRLMRGYALPDVMAAAAIAALAGALAVQLLSQTLDDLRRARTRLAAAQLLERLYEEARVSPPAELDSPRQGRVGELQWYRSAEPVRPEQGAPGVLKVRFRIDAPRAGKVLDVEAYVRPVGADVTGLPAIASPKS